MLHGRDGAVGGPVVGVGRGEAPVGDEEERRDAVPRDRGRAAREEHHPAGEHGDEEHRGRGGEDALHALAVELGERDPAALVVLAQQERRDDEARDHEEDVDAEEAAGRPREQVIEDDRDHGEGAEALDVAAERPRARTLRRDRRGSARAGGSRARHRVLAGGGGPDARWRASSAGGRWRSSGTLRAPATGVISVPMVIERTSPWRSVRHRAKAARTPVRGGHVSGRGPRGGRSRAWARE